ncbi:MAG: hypothetical protein ACT6FG_04100 [Methanosarcinaceae archaeon]
MNTPQSSAPAPRIISGLRAELNIFDRRAIKGRSPIVDTGVVLIIGVSCH